MDREAETCEGDEGAGAGAARAFGAVRRSKVRESQARSGNAMGWIATGRGQFARVTAFSRRRDDGDADGIFARGTPVWAYEAYAPVVAAQCSYRVDCSRGSSTFK